MAICAMAFLSASCYRKTESEESTEFSVYRVPTIETEFSVPADNTKYAERKEARAKLASETDAEGKTISQWPTIELSGRPDEVIEIEEDCFYEGDRFFLFFQKGVHVRGDLPAHMSRIMGELEEELHLSFERDPVNSDTNWRFLYFNNKFSDVNKDLKKLNILILNDPMDGRIEWAGESVAVLYDKDVLDPDQGLYVAYHEMAHSLHIRQCSPLGRVFNEGVAMYAEYKLSVRENRPDRDLAWFMADERYAGYDQTEIYLDPVGTFIKDTEIYSGPEERNYQYGFRFVTFLMEEYGDDVIDKICRSSLRFDYTEDRTDMMIRSIQDATSKDVFERFAKWLPEGWAKFDQDYKEFMKQFSPIDLPD